MPEEIVQKFFNFIQNLWQKWVVSRLLLLLSFLIFVNASPENAEFGTLLIVGKIKFNNDDAILFVYDDAVLVPNTNVAEEFDAKMDELVGVARKNYTLKNTHKKMN